MKMISGFSWLNIIAQAMTILAVFLGVALATSVDLQDQVDKLERRLHDSIENAQKQAMKKAEMETALKEMEERL